MPGKKKKLAEEKTLNRAVFSFMSLIGEMTILASGMSMTRSDIKRVQKNLKLISEPMLGQLLKCKDQFLKSTQKLLDAMEEFNNAATDEITAREAEDESEKKVEICEVCGDQYGTADTERAQYPAGKKGWKLHKKSDAHKDAKRLLKEKKAAA